MNAAGCPFILPPFKVEPEPELPNFDQPKYELHVHTSSVQSLAAGQPGPSSTAEVAEVSLFQVAETPTNMYDYMLPGKACKKWIFEH